MTPSLGDSGETWVFSPEKLGRKMVVNCKVAVDVGCITDRSVPEIEINGGEGPFVKKLFACVLAIL